VFYHIKVFVANVFLRSVNSEIPENSGWFMSLLSLNRATGKLRDVGSEVVCVGSAPLSVDCSAGVSA
jgi:hypothetical protein